MTKYDATDAYYTNPETGVLYNTLNIINDSDLKDVETLLLDDAFDRLALRYSKTHKFGEPDIRFIHKEFLGSLYSWAGKYRLVNISSSGLEWCQVRFIEAQMKEFGKLLKRLTPFASQWTRQDIIRHLAVIHGELVVVHPFRDGNGRTTRLLCDLLLMQANHRPIGRIFPADKAFREKYYEGIREVWRCKEYTILIKMLEELIG